MGSDIVVVFVGPDRQKMGIHKNLLCATSPSFAHAIESLLAEGKAINFSTESPMMFKLFVEFLYTKQVPRVRSSADLIDQADRLRNLCKMYTFTEKYAMHNEVCIPKSYLLTDILTNIDSQSCHGYYPRRLFLS